MASLNRLYLAYRSQGLEVLAISVDEDIHLVREFLVKLTLDFPILLDRGAVRTKQEFKVTRFPTTFLVDRSQRIRNIWIGERDWDAPAIRSEVAALLT
ncbi:MAG: Peroxiredoxin [Proteobacteria bacterium]|nr:Peroxiredoxin [Pseudomonadota bacterium]